MMMTSYDDEDINKNETAFLGGIQSYHIVVRTGNNVCLYNVDGTTVGRGDYEDDVVVVDC